MNLPRAKLCQLPSSEGRCKEGLIGGLKFEVCRRFENGIYAAGWVGGDVQ